MSDKPPRSVFLERSGYTRRRMADAAFLLPVFGALLLMMPILWPNAPTEAGPDAGGISLSGAILYVFGVWLLLILGAAVFGLWVRRTGDETPEPGSGEV